MISFAEGFCSSAEPFYYEQLRLLLDFFKSLSIGIGNASV